MNSYIRVKIENDQYYINKSDVKKAVGSDLIVENFDKDCEYCLYDEVEKIYDKSNQVINLIPPSNWYVKKNVSLSNRLEKENIENSDFGINYNYEIYLSDQKSNLYNDITVFKDNWNFINTFKLEEQGINRLSSNFTYIDPNLEKSISIGDVSTKSRSWGGGYNIGGISFKSDYSRKRDFVQYPVPELAFSTRVPTEMDLYINGYKRYSNSFSSGDYRIEQPPIYNGHGEYEITTYDQNGNTLRQTYDFYVSSELLKKGLSVYQFDMGFLRSVGSDGYIDYDDFIVSGDVSYGLRDWLTVNTLTAYTAETLNSGIESKLNLYNLGVLSLSLNISESYGDFGLAKNIGYDYTSSKVNLKVEASIYDDFSEVDYNEITDDNEYNDSYSLKDYEVRAFVNYSLPLGGYIGASISNIRYMDESKEVYYSVNYSKSLTENITFYGNASHTEDESMISLNLSLALDNLFIRYGRSEQDDNSSNDYSLSMNNIDDSSLDIDLYYHDTNKNYDAQISYETNKLFFKAGQFSSEGNKTNWGSAKGALGLIDGQFYTSKQINNSMILVDTSGIKGVEVYSNNQFKGVTDEDGKLIMANVTPYLKQNIELSEASIPYQLDIVKNSLETNLYENSGVIIEFDFKKPLRRTIYLLGERMTGEPVSTPKGYTLVGYDNMIYVENVENGETIKVGNLDKMCEFILSDEEYYDCK